MNKKGQLGYIYILVILAVGVLFATSILKELSNPVATLTNKVNVFNQTLTAPAVGENVTGLLYGQAVSNVIVTNATNGVLIPSSNYSITNYVLASDGTLKTTFQSLQGNIGFQGRSINVSYTYEPFGYDTNPSGRATASLILLGAALIIMAFVLVPVLRNFSFK